MLDIINYENFREFTYSNDKICKKPYRGVVVQFHGLGDGDVFNEDIKGLDPNVPKTHAQIMGEFFAEQSILYIIPYTNPWCWMNDNTVKFVDKLVSVLTKEYGVEDFPIVSLGPSMGGQSAILWSARSAHKDKIVACVTNCPVCDPLSLSPDLLPKRALLSAFFDENKDFYQVVKNYSPMEITSELRDIDYFVFQCDADTAVVKELHADKFVQKMKEHGFNIEYFVEHGKEHCQLQELSPLYRKCVIDSLDKANANK